MVGPWIHAVITILDFIILPITIIIKILTSYNLFGESLGGDYFIFNTVNSLAILVWTAITVRPIFLGACGKSIKETEKYRSNMKNLAKERTRGEKQDNFKRLVHEVENIDDKVAADLNDSF